MIEILVLGIISFLNVIFFIKFKVKYIIVISCITSFILMIIWFQREGGIRLTLFFHNLWLIIVVFFFYFSVITTVFNIFQSIVRILIKFMKK